MLLALNLVLPILVLAVALAQDRLGNSSPDWSARRRANWRLAFLGCLFVITSITLFITWEKDVQARGKQTRIAQAAQEREDKAHTERKEISDEIRQLAALVGEMDPGLTDEQALSRVGREIHRLRDRTSELEDEIDGLRKYSRVARLNVVGLSGRAGKGLTESTPESRALEGAFKRTGEGSTLQYSAKCDDEGMSQYRYVAAKLSDFPFAHWALASCLRTAGDPRWREHAERAKAILDHTTRISERSSHHDQAHAKVSEWLRQPE